MTLLFIGIVAFVALVVAGLFLPVLWVPAAAILVLGLVYALRTARAAEGGERV